MQPNWPKSRASGRRAAQPVIDAVFPLQDAADAHRRGQQGHTHGKMVLQVVG